MAYLTFSTGVEEVHRCELAGPIVVGRAPDCDVSIHDILLSRRHCRIETTDGGGTWTLIDLQSKNGTFLSSAERIAQQALSDGDVIQVGKTRITFRAGSFIPAARRLEHDRPIRPIDPQDALAGTVSGLAYVEPPPPLMSPFHLPTPKPRPRDPEAFARDGLYSMLDEIASSSWDSIYAVNAKPLRPQRDLPRPIVRAAGLATNRAARPHRPGVNLALQAAPLILPDLPRPIPWSLASGPPTTAQRHRSGALSRIARGVRARLARAQRWMTAVARGATTGRAAQAQQVNVSEAHVPSAGSISADIEPAQLAIRASAPNAVI